MTTSKTLARWTCRSGRPSRVLSTTEFGAKLIFLLSLGRRLALSLGHRLAHSLVSLIPMGLLAGHSAVEHSLATRTSAFRLGGTSRAAARLSTVHLVTLHVGRQVTVDRCREPTPRDLAPSLLEVVDLLFLSHGRPRNLVLAVRVRGGDGERPVCLGRHLALLVCGPREPLHQGVRHGPAHTTT